MFQGEDDENEPGWVNAEREQFSQFRDKDKDGYMDKEEVGVLNLNYSKLFKL